MSHGHRVYIGRKVSPKSRLKLCRENINTYRLEDSAWEHILPAFNSDSSVVPGHWQHAARFSLKNHKNKPLYRCRLLDIFASFKAPWTERLLSTSLSVLLTSKFTPEWCFKFCLHHSIAFPIQSRKFFHKILQSHKVHTVRFITETKPLPVPICVLVSFSATVGEKEERKKHSSGRQLRKSVLTWLILPAYNPSSTEVIAEVQAVKHEGMLVVGLLTWLTHWIILSWHFDILQDQLPKEWCNRQWKEISYIN